MHVALLFLDEWFPSSSLVKIRDKEGTTYYLGFNVLTTGTYLDLTYSESDCSTF
jgi:hypothetical protein